MSDANIFLYIITFSVFAAAMLFIWGYYRKTNEQKGDMYKGQAIQFIPYANTNTQYPHS
jgi:high-affinity Fe2+/Pb2+ permease